MTIQELVAQSVSRANRWHGKEGMEQWSALEWAGAMCGEAGEAANAAKKLRRIEQDVNNINKGDRQISNVEHARHEITKEVCDTILYGIILVARVGGNLEETLKEVFNAKSEEYNFPERL